MEERGLIRKLHKKTSYDNQRKFAMSMKKKKEFLLTNKQMMNEKALSM
jgi:hypothetical protein